MKLLWRSPVISVGWSLLGDELGLSYQAGWGFSQMAVNKCEISSQRMSPLNWSETMRRMKNEWHIWDDINSIWVGLSHMTSLFVSFAPVFTQPQSYHTQCHCRPLYRPIHLGYLIHSSRRANGVVQTIFRCKHHPDEIFYHKKSCVVIAKHLVRTASYSPQCNACILLRSSLYLDIDRY